MDVPTRGTWARRTAILAILAMGLPAAAAASGEAPAGTTAVKAAASAPEGPTEALESLRKAYREENSEAFFSRIAANPRFNASDLKQRVTDFFYQSGDIDLVFMIQDQLPDNDRMLVKIRWQKRYTSGATGKVVTGEGASDLVFERSGAGGSYKLLDIQKDNPF